MLEQRKLYRDLAALALLAGVIFLSLALVSYNRADCVGALPAPFHFV